MLRAASAGALEFESGGARFCIPLTHLVEVTPARKPGFIPRLPVGVSGVMNVRGEPLPVVESEMLLTGERSRSSRHVLVMERDDVRLGLLVERVTSLRADAGGDASAKPGEETPEGSLVTWVESDPRIGWVDSEFLLEAAVDLLSGARSQGDQSCHPAF
jgi:chemotaxis signal transduction protein